MAKYRKKPVVVEAVQWKGENWTEISTLLGYFPLVISDRKHFFIDTIEGVMTASLGDYIIKGVNGEFYPCEPDIFEKTYEAVEEDA